MTCKEIIKVLNKEMNSKRLIHTMGVYAVAVKLAKVYEQDKEQVGRAALLHDYAKGTMTNDEMKQYITKYLDPKLLKNHPNTWHADVAHHLIQIKFKEKNKDVLEAVKYHVNGKESLSDIGKIVFIADVCEPNRKHIDKDMILNTALKDLDDGLYMSVVRKMYQMMFYNKRQLDPNLKKLYIQLGGTIFE